MSTLVHWADPFEATYGDSMVAVGVGELCVGPEFDVVLCEAVELLVVSDDKASRVRMNADQADQLIAALSGAVAALRDPAVTA